MNVKIYRPAKSLAQSGDSKKYWILEFIQDVNLKFVEKILHGISSSDTAGQVTIKFPTEKEALDFAQKNGYDYEIIKRKEYRPPLKSYSDNFR